ncbi:MAG: hypothetical protein AB1505_21905, partial [Candidatus Latescibacterota bacterium]
VHLPLTDLATEDVVFFDLTYHDRLEWEESIASISEIHKVMRVSPPAIWTPSGFNNVFSRYTYHCPELGGFGIVGINTETSPTGKQLIRFEDVLRDATTGMPGGTARRPCSQFCRAVDDPEAAGRQQAPVSSPVRALYRRTRK